MDPYRFLVEVYSAANSKLTELRRNVLQYMFSVFGVYRTKRKFVPNHRSNNFQLSENVLFPLAATS